MKNLRQDIRIFQDAKDNKTTIVCWGLSKQTKEKLVQILLDDIQAVETVTGLENTSPDFADDVKSVQGMTQVISNTELDAQLSGMDIPTQIDTLCTRYELEKNPQYTDKIRQLVPQVYNMDANSMRMVLYSLRNLSTSVLNKLAMDMGYGDISKMPNRDDLLVQAITNAAPETLLDVLHNIMG